MDWLELIIEELEKDKEMDDRIPLQIEIDDYYPIIDPGERTKDSDSKRVIIIDI